MKYLLILLASLAASLGFSVADSKPNIIYINADDLGVMDVGFNSERYHTPNIDQLRAEGMLFTDAYAPAANCAPSRACVLSGQYSPRHGVYTVGNSDRGKSRHRKLIPIQNTDFLTPENLTIADALKAGGYKTIHLGKWHVTKDPLQNGFDVNIGGDHSGGPRGGYFSPFSAPLMKRFNELYPAGTHRVDVFADQAIQFMRAHKADPFFVHMSYYSVHTKLEPVPEFIENYQGKKGVNPVYASMIEKMDQGIGKILAEVETLGLKENTMVLFCSDNGGITNTSSQKPFRSGKGSYFEGGIREPLVVRWPGKIKPDSTCPVPVIGTDFYPTFLDAAGIPVPDGKQLDGQSLMPLLTQSGSIPDRTLYWHFPVYLQQYAGLQDDSHDPLFRTRPGSALRLGKWKFHEYFEDGRIELYDLESDVGERTNVAKNFPEKVAKFHRMLKQWRKEINAPVPTTPNPKFAPDDKSNPRAK